MDDIRTSYAPGSVTTQTNAGVTPFQANPDINFFRAVASRALSGAAPRARPRDGGGSGGTGPRLREGAGRADAMDQGPAVSGSYVKNMFGPQQAGGFVRTGFQPGAVYGGWDPTGGADGPVHIAQADPSAERASQAAANEQAEKAAKAARQAEQNVWLDAEMGRMRRMGGGG